MFCINACSLNKIFDDMEFLLKYTNKQFDVAAATGTRITINTSKLLNISIKNHVVGSTPS